MRSAIALKSLNFPSVRLSTATLLSAVTSTRCGPPAARNARISSTVVRVLPVPGGPCPRSAKGKQVLLPAWDCSKTALAGCESGSGRRKSGDLGPISVFIGYPKPALAEPRHRKLPNSPAAMSE
jgi:hypothetical protein